MNADKLHIRHCILHYFHRGKTAAEVCRIICNTYGEHTVSERTCQDWFKRFRDGNFNVNDKPRSGRPQAIVDEELQALLDENPSQTQKELALQLGVTQATVSNRLHAMGKIQKEGKWVPHQLTEEHCARRFDTCLALLTRHMKKSFLWQIVTGDEKWIFYDNPKRKKSWVDPGQSTAATPRRNIHGHKVLLCIWWDRKGVLYYELLEPGNTVTAERYKQQLYHLNDALKEKRPDYSTKRRKVIFLHDNARPHVAAVTKQALLDLEWEVLPHPAYSPDIAPSDFHLFRSMQHGLLDTHFRNAAEVKNWIDNYIASKDETFYHRGIGILPERWKKVVDSKGNYFD